MIVVAQCCSWYGVLTTNTLAHAIENSIWAVAFLLVGVGLCWLLPEYGGLVRLSLVVAIVGIAAYLAFLITIDVPMYLNRWQEGLADGRKALSPLEGLRDASTRWVVTHDFAQWKDEIAWMSLYFTAAVWASLALCLVYALGDHLPRYRTEPAARVMSVAPEQYATIEAHCAVVHAPRCNTADAYCTLLCHRLARCVASVGRNSEAYCAVVRMP